MDLKIGRKNDCLLISSFVLLLSVFIGIEASGQQMKYKSAFVKVVPDSLNREIISLDIVTSGGSRPLSLIKVNLAGSEKSTATLVKVFYTDQRNSFSKTGLIDSFSSFVSGYSLKVPQTLIEGHNYFWFVTTGKLQIKSFALGEQEYQQVWSDEFNGDTIETSNWSFEKGFARNHEAQWYQEQNATCKEGILTIEAKRVHYPNPNYQAGSNDWRKNREFIEYTSSSMETRGKQAWQYGRFEMRARIDTVLGYWPAWWTLGVNKPWPSNGEIDIMEYYRGKVLANIAVGNNRPYNALWFSNTKPVKSFAANWKDQFHEWRMDWDENGIGLYLDDVLMNYQPQSNLVNRDGTGFFPFNQKHYMLLNLAIAGDNGGDPSSTAFPLKYEIDYVRVSQKRTGSFRSVKTYHPK